MRAEMSTCLRLVAVTIMICVVAYPLVVLAVSAVIAPEARMGSLIVNREGQVIGSRLVAQRFTRPEYLWPRPSAVDYDASAAGGSNLSPANPAIRERAEAILSQLALPEDVPAPADLVTTSGSGLDPHISYDAAIVQVTRIAKARDMSEDEVLKIIDQIAEEVPLTSESARIVNVLQLNMALDEIQLHGHTQ